MTVVKWFSERTIKFMGLSGRCLLSFPNETRNMNKGTFIARMRIRAIKNSNYMKHADSCNITAVYFDARFWSRSDVLDVSYFWRSNTNWNVRNINEFKSVLKESQKFFITHKQLDSERSFFRMTFASTVKFFAPKKNRLTDRFVGA